MNNSITIISSLLIFLFPYLGKKWFNRNVLANTVVTLGVLGTFSGIFIGLIHFDVDNIEAALPMLLEGLKTAFLTSIAGMCSSLLLKLYPSFYGIRPEKKKEETSETELLLQLLTKIEANTAATQQATVENLQSLNRSFTTFAQHISDLNVEAMTSALEKVMEQWDSQVSQEMNTTLQAINQSVQKLEESETLNTEKIGEISEDIKKAVEALEKSTGNLGNYLQQSVSMSNRHSQAISGQMNQLGNLVKTTEEQMGKQMNEMEQRFKRELSAMEQFTNTLLLIIKKLSMDHNAINKQQQEEN